MPECLRHLRKLSFVRAAFFCQAVNATIHGCQSQHSHDITRSFLVIAINSPDRGTRKAWEATKENTGRNFIFTLGPYIIGT